VTARKDPLQPAVRVLVVDDDVQLAATIAFGLRLAGFEVAVAHDGRAALAAVEEQPDLVLLDVNLPDTDGFQVLRAIRSLGDTPVIMLTVRGDDDDVVRGLDLGADDYVSKPFGPDTLVARMRAVLRRSGALTDAMPAVGDLRLDLDRREVRRGDARPQRLTPLEFRLLRYLMANASGVLTHDALIEHVWGYAAAGDKVLLKQLVRRLRRKIEPDPARPRYLQAVPGAGYVLSAPDPAEG